jgi:hypothetical protein
VNRAAVNAAAVLDRLASLRLTLFILAGLAAGVLWTYHSQQRTTLPLVLPLGLFAINLLAAIVVRPAFRRQPGLLVFHLALIAVLLLVAAGRLTYLRGHIGIATGAEAHGALDQEERGPWHRDRLAQAIFTNEGFAIEYGPGLQRGATYNRVSWLDADGRRHAQVIGDTRALVLHGYRFYTIFNKGFAPVFTWIPPQGAAVSGAVNLPSYPLNDYRQALEWSPPGTELSIWTLLEFEEAVLDPDLPGHFRLPERHSVVLRWADQRHDLVPGDTLALAEGTLRYDGLTTWMGYRVHYDWTVPWLFAACFIGIGGLGWFYWQRFSRHPWRAGPADAELAGRRAPARGPSIPGNRARGLAGG